VYSPFVRRLTVAGFLCGAALPAHAQNRTEFTPFVGSYYHTTHISDGSSGPFAGNKFTFDQTNAIAVGARFTLPIGDRIGIEGEFAYAPSGVRFTEQDALGSGVDGGLAADGYLLFGSLRAVLSPRRSNLFFLLGPAVVKRGGDDAWGGFDSGDLVDFGGVGGFGIRANVTPRFRLNFTAETYLYSLDPDGSGGNDSKFQADVLVTVGVPISFGAR
jgi:hypothetical protein